MDQKREKIITYVMKPLQDYYGKMDLPLMADSEFLKDRWAAALAEFDHDTLRKGVETIFITNDYYRWPTLKAVYQACFDVKYPHGKMTEGGTVVYGHER
jgi:hypothetical protein